MANDDAGTGRTVVVSPDAEEVRVASRRRPSRPEA